MQMFNSQIRLPEIAIAYPKALNLNPNYFEPRLKVHIIPVVCFPANLQCVERAERVRENDSLATWTFLGHMILG